MGRQLPLISPEPSISSVGQLAVRLGAQWKHIDSAYTKTHEKKQQLSEALEGLDSADTSIVAFGSLARNEFTESSDIDWTLLIDGQAAPEHLATTRKIKEEIDKLEGKGPGREGIFGNLAFSHEIIHQIGGQNDTNANTTQRILMLLESCVLGRKDAHDRVIRNILGRYLSEDRGMWHGSGVRKIPRFLLNDIARYWRTMAVDLAYKQRTRGGMGFALRSTKLGISRKLIFIAGLVSCFSFETELDDEQRHDLFANGVVPVLAHLKSVMSHAPLEVVASALLRYPALDPSSLDLFNAYDEFLGLLVDEKKRIRLDTMSDEDLSDDPTFEEARKIRSRFRRAVDSIFLSRNNLLGQLTIEYGVF